MVLPLADQTLRILRHYLRRGRPGGKHPELFLRASTPVGPLTHYAIGDLYQKRAGQSGLPLQGTSSYCLRHSFAMRLLDRGIGVKVIGDLLGHHTLESTCVYLRLETGAFARGRACSADGDHWPRGGRQMSATLQCSAFDQLADRYLRRQRSLGRAYVNEERIIDGLRRFLEKTSRSDLDQALFDAWCAAQGHLSANRRRNRQRIVRDFCLSTAYRANLLRSGSTVSHIAGRMHRRSSLGRPRSPGCWPRPIVWPRRRPRRFGQP
ncbi:tyrosine-type recombinase/integrase [Bradyrhizobium sp. CCBAU 53421]|uniref:tyrosine-type recombinase/integrase n=1 Tax=Bradyrhizobium sp. CCBAU 53421 TaxID=1325120 RepID=UPI003530467D